MITWIKLDLVFIVNNAVDTPSQPSTFDQLSRISMTHLTRSKVESEELDQTTEDLGFFFDSTPQPVSNPVKPHVSRIRKKRSATKLHESDTKASSSNYQAKKRKVILDDSIHIDSEDDLDDVSSISSSEDISMLDALAHWGSSNAMFEEEPAGHRFHSDDEEDYAILKNTPISDIFDSDQDIITTLDSDEEEQEASANAFDWQMDDSVNVPDHMKHSYRAILEEERRAGQPKKQKKPKNKASRIRAAAKGNLKKENLIDRITDEFVSKPKLSRYLLTDLTHLGRHTVAPKLAKLFKLKIVEAKSSETIVEFRRTPMTPTYQDLKKSTKRAKHRETRHVEKKVSRVQFKEDANHGKQVASSSEPISSSNVGHRMLAAMGWKEGEAIGNNENGIKEPVKVYLRAKRRGLGA
ncbi:G-patch domain-containing protein [Mucor lusitanicus]|uniref:G-patch domain-containing protein n=1 Tax=Mucor circinelloides f. lusitanicus TaxID=29924 RepID=A0A8H4EZ81_MUCCL|nr:G-patch domain-containing protein [Mucor lusitanicus]